MQRGQRIRGMLRSMKYPEWVRYGNLGLAFMLELAALISFAAAGLLLSGWLQLVGIIAGGVLFIVLWGLFAAPKSKRRLKGMNLLLFKIGMFAAAAISLMLVGQLVWGVVLAILAAVHLTAARVLRQH